MMKCIKCGLEFEDDPNFKGKAFSCGNCGQGYIMINGKWIPGDSYSIQYSPIQLKIIDTLSKRGAMNRDQLVHTTNEARTTIYDNLNKLKGRGIVIQMRQPLGKHKRGRPQELFIYITDAEDYQEKSKKMKRKK